MVSSIRTEERVGNKITCIDGVNGKNVKIIFVFVLIGVLAACAPAYQDYTAKAQVAEGLNLASDPRAAVVEYYEDLGEPPANNAEVGFGSDPHAISGKYVESVAIVSGRIDILYGNDAHQLLQGKTLSITPYDVNGNVVWRCGAAPIPTPTDTEVRARISKNYQPGTLSRHPELLPMACR